MNKKMWICSTIVLSFLFVGCHRDMKVVNRGVERVEEMEVPETEEEEGIAEEEEEVAEEVVTAHVRMVEDTVTHWLYKPYRLVYRQRVNGYRVEADFVTPTDNDAGGWRGGYALHMGRALLHFSKAGHSFGVYCDAFTDCQLIDWSTVDDPSLYNNVIDLDKVAKGGVVVLDYTPPRDGEYLSGDSPFYFRDMDFDGEEELVVNNLTMGERHANTYDVFKVFGQKLPLRLTGLPFAGDGYKMCGKNVEYNPTTKSVVDTRYDGIRIISIRRYVFG